MQQPAASPSNAAFRSDQPEVPFGPNAIRLSPGEWVVALGLTCALMYVIPTLWERIEPFESGPDYRLPYRLGNDYWMAARHFRRAASDESTLVFYETENRYKKLSFRQRVRRRFESACERLLEDVRDRCAARGPGASAPTLAMLAAPTGALTN